jgi:hypothetical protein
MTTGCRDSPSRVLGAAAKNTPGQTREPAGRVQSGGHQFDKPDDARPMVVLESAAAGA